MRKIAIISISVAGPALWADTADAQRQSDTWTFRVTPYVVGTAMDGKLIIHGGTAKADVGFDDILESLEFGA